MLLHRFPEVSVPAGTTEANPQRTRLSLIRARLVRVEIMVPPGHRGETGIRLELDGGVIIPFDRSEWLVMDGETFDTETPWDLPSGRLDAVTFNTDIVAHSFFLRLHLETDRGRPAFGPLVPLAVAASPPLSTDELLARLSDPLFPE